ncbi:MAG: CHRD domain-containing protein [Dehalococcoidia bacterium]
MWWIVGIVAAALIALAPSAISAQTAALEFDVSLSGDEEVPANDSAATGTFTATLNDADELEWTLSVPEIDAATAAHLHVGAAGVNGPIVVTLFMAEGDPVGSIDVSGTATVAELEGPVEGDFEAFRTALESDEIYVNVHTTALPPGEIRAQLLTAAQATPTATASPTGTAAPTGTPAAAPGAADTGNGGLTAQQSILPVLLGIVALVALAGGGRLLTIRRR